MLKWFDSFPTAGWESFSITWANRSCELHTKYKPAAIIGKITHDVKAEYFVGIVVRTKTQHHDTSWLELAKEMLRENGIGQNKVLIIGYQKCSKVAGKGIYVQTWL